VTEPIYDGGTPTTDFSTTETGAIDYTSPAGMVRLNITDVADNPADRIFDDAQLTAFLTLAGENINRASARALRVIAASEVLIGKVIRTQAGTSTDGAKVSAELRALADSYDAQANAEDSASVEGFFDVVPFDGCYKPEGAEWRY
jgi:hypothetical protein